MCDSCGEDRGGDGLQTEELRLLPMPSKILCGFQDGTFRESYRRGDLEPASPTASLRDADQLNLRAEAGG